MPGTTQVPRRPALLPAARADLPALLASLLLGVALFLGTARAPFLYDDERQIVRNTLIQEEGRLGEALLSDVWAFKGGPGSSGYWRPTFVAWIALQHRLWGLESTVGWHLANVALHAAVVALAYLLARRLGLTWGGALALAALFAAHPAHVESVAWISGSPDLLVGLSLLASLHATLSAVGGRGRRPLFRIAALACYALALGAKEIAVLFPAILVAALWVRPAETESTPSPRMSLAAAARAAIPFAVLSGTYLVTRRLLLSPSPNAHGDFADSIWTLPAAFVFYLRQAFVPVWLGPSYPLRRLAPREIDLVRFALPAAIALLALAGIAALGRRSRLARLGAALFLLLLAPALLLSAFHPEQLVHDRYLYLPLLGLLFLVVPPLARLAGAGSPLWRKRALVAAAALVTVFFSMQTVGYSRAWTSELELWRRGVTSDPGSAWNHLELAVALDDAGRYDEARIAADRSLEIRELPNARLVRARIAIAQRRFADAERDLLQLLDPARQVADAYTLYQGYEALAVARERTRQLAGAAQALRHGRRRLPIYAAALTEKLAVILYLQGDRSAALAELEAHREGALSETLPESRQVLYRIGLLYAEAGREPEARRAFEEFLRATENLGDASTREIRAKVARALGPPG